MRRRLIIEKAATFAHLHNGAARRRLTTIDIEPDYLAPAGFDRDGLDHGEAVFLILNAGDVQGRVTYVAIDPYIAAQLGASLLAVASDMQARIPYDMRASANRSPVTVIRAVS